MRYIDLLYGSYNGNYPPENVLDLELFRLSHVRLWNAKHPCLALGSAMLQEGSWNTTRHAYRNNPNPKPKP